jgi:hypothetical protein
MKIWSRPCSDVGMTVLNYNRPKVGIPRCAAWALPLPTVTLVSVAGCMQENPEYPFGTRLIGAVTIRRWVIEVRSRRKTRRKPLRRDPQRPYASHLEIHRDEEMVRTLRRRKEVGRNDRPVRFRSATRIWT